MATTKKAQKKSVPKRTSELPEPARSVARDVERQLAETERNPREATRKAIEQALEWMHSRAPHTRQRRRSAP
jgi:hypothetical protein